MELMYPFVIYIDIPIIILLLILKFKKSNIYKDGKKVANTKYVKNIPYYKDVMRKYKILSYWAKGACLISIFLSLVLLSRPAVVDTSDSRMYNRDIFLCMDVSQSVDEVNIELIKTYKDIVNNLKGERFGISIFNTSSVLLVPLTDDYDYIISVLDTLAESFRINSSDYNWSDNIENWFYLQYYIQDGTLLGVEDRGSSIIGDGLASCIYSFSSLEENRTRIIIFSTDNELEGEQIVTLQEAGELAKSKNITVYGISPRTIGNPCLGLEHDLDEHKNAEPEFRKAVETTGGKLYIEGTERDSIKYCREYRATTKNFNARAERNQKDRYS